ncbi:SCO family protein [Robertmurraya korlensis]|uniref:SCO family protein n=1 Tax=Robertmurraya korlensis TaxID=519977 RepID=UPI00203E45E9|nr:SCO family protein [Robertmurraya korlensis]MCM3602715.1 SCO family protein [Robertmurraya korlensis]
MKLQVLLIFLTISIVGFLSVYWFWPKAEKLPVLDTIETFQMEDVYNEVYTTSNEKIKIVSFFYTNCPDVCPLTMMDFQDLQENLKKEGLFGTSVELVSITLDPEYDTKQVIREYAQAFETDPVGWKWLRGPTDQTKRIADEFQMQYKKIEGDLLTHSVTLYLIDKDNQLRALYDMASPKKSVEKEKILTDIMLLTQ